ncbi:MAG: single-stranded-DNA-specific exonuclease RecJ [Bacteroidetes bacterium]|nr:single-stranded-DNA-specific exonuclease RecJ [Bacteroidota bacterium]
MTKGPVAIWKAKPLPSPTEIAQLQANLALDEKILILLLQRGIRSFNEARNFFKPSLDQLLNPFLMKDMDLAVNRVQAAIDKAEKILIYGDYDVDGTTAVSLMARFLEPHYSNFETYIPDRYKEGYGVSKLGIDYAHEKGIQLIIALDCGIKALEKVDYAKSKGIDFIICDHHTPGPEIPQAVAVLDPKRKDCKYPYKGLSGCGVGFKLCQALNEKWQGEPEQLWPLLDLLALSIGADIVPMDGENRTLAYFGLKRINSAPSDGIAALLKSSGIRKSNYDIGDLVFTLAPRINAAGRLEHGQKAVDLLRGSDLSLLPDIAQEIESRNLARKKLDRSIFKEALAQVESHIPAENFSTLVFQKDWHKGVIGIVASRLIEVYYRPTIVLTQSGDKLAGSARSVQGFDLYRALEACEDHLLQFGGHPAAAGMTLLPERLNDFKAAFETAVAQQIKPEQRRAQHEYDLEVKAEELDDKFYRLLQRFAPYGPENLSPLLLCRGLKDVGSRLVGEDQKHLKLSLVDERSGLILDGIGFNLGSRLDLLKYGTSLAVLFHLELNVFRDRASLQIRALDIKADETLNDKK